MYIYIFIYSYIKNFLPGIVPSLSLIARCRAADGSRDAMPQKRHDIRNMLELLLFGKLSLKYY